MVKYSIVSALTTLLVFAGPSAFAIAGSEDVVVDKAWSRASIGISRPGAAYMSISNTADQPIMLIGIKTPVSMISEIHETKTNSEGVSSMMPTGEISIPPGETLELLPGGLHVMLVQLKSPLKQGKTFPLTLFFNDGGNLTVAVEILAIAARGLKD